MNKSALLSCLPVAVLLLAGCVSTNTAPDKPPADSQQAAQRHYQLGVEYYKKGSYDLARDRLSRAIDFDPDMAIAHTLLALTYIQLENKRLATQHYEKAVKLEPGDVNVRNAYAIFLCAEKKFDDAKKQFDRAIGVYDNDEKQIMMTNAGVCMINKPDYELAEQYLRDALAFKSSYSEALLQLAILKYKTEDFLRARAFLQRYMVSNPSSPQVLYLCSQVERELGDDRASTDCLNDLLRDHPNSSEAQYVKSKQPG